MTPHIHPDCIDFMQRLPDQQGLERQAARYMLASTMWLRFGDTDGSEILAGMLDSPGTHPTIADRIKTLKLIQSPPPQ